jgi:predicted enzyme related to lactoylglutathione lyase
VTVTANALSELSLVAVPSSDQDRSIEFYVGLLGFEKRTDTPFGERYRWVEVYPPNGTTGIALAPPPPDGAIGVRTGIILTSEDIDATHAEMKAAGADVDAAVARMGSPVPPMFSFRDPDANSLMVVERA